ncbi:MAG: PIG-L deacetylase family protein [Paracoccaceae bacterium]
MRRILVFAAHPDDEVLGCGASIARLTHRGDKVQVVFLADGFASRNNGDDRTMPARKAAKLLGCEVPIFLNFADNQMDKAPLLDIVKEVEEIVGWFLPNIVYTHHYGDLNIDHQVTHRAVMTACRPQPDFCVREIYSFEVLSASHWQSISMSRNFSPNYFVDVSDFIATKMKALDCYMSEMREFPHARSYEAVKSLSKLRGSSVGVHDAEAFCVERLLG